MQFTKKEDRFNKVYGGDGVPVPLFDMEDIEDTQLFDEYALPDAPPPDAGQHVSDYERNGSVIGVGDR